MQPVADPIDIDARLAAKFGERKKVAPRTAPVKLFDQEFRVIQHVDAYNMLRLANPETSVVAVGSIFARIIHEDDRDRFSRAMAEAGLDDEEMMEIFLAVVEAAAAGNPTDSSSDSRPTTRKKAAAKRSVVRSGAKASTRTR